MTTSLSPRLLERLDAYWRAANYLKFGQLYLTRLFRRFSLPGGIPNHTAAETPGSINEGGELEYSLPHEYGADFDKPDLIVACVVGDDEAETGALAASWHSKKFLDPEREGAMLSILHLNGYKIANPTVFARNQH